MKSILVMLGKLMSIRVAAIGLTFVQTIVMTRAFGSELFGLLSFALSISALAILLLSMGLDQLLMRDIARVGQKRAPQTQAWRDTWHLVFAVVIPSVVFVSVVGGAVVIFTPVTGPYKAVLVAAIALLPIMIARKYIEAISLGTKRVIRSIIGSQIVYPILMILGGLVVWLTHVEASRGSIAFTYIFAGIGSLIASVLLTRATLQDLKERTGVAEDARERSPGSKALLKSGMHFSLVSLGFVLGQHIDVLLTGVLATPEDVALVRIASRVAELAALMRAIILLQYKPLLAEAYGNDDHEKLQAHATFMVKLFVATGLPLTIFLWIFAEQVMGVFGPEFVEGAWAMRVYVAGVLFVLICGPCNSILAMTSKENIASRIIWIGLVINIVLDIFLIPKFGALGCALANAFSMAVVGVLSTQQSRRQLNVDTTILSIFGKRTAD